MPRKRRGEGREVLVAHQHRDVADGVASRLDQPTRLFQSAGLDVGVRRVFPVSSRKCRRRVEGLANAWRAIAGSETSEKRLASM